MALPQWGVSSAVSPTEELGLGAVRKRPSLGSQQDVAPALEETSVWELCSAMGAVSVSSQGRCSGPGWIFWGTPVASACSQEHLEMVRTLWVLTYSSLLKKTVYLCRDSHLCNVAEHLSDFFALLYHFGSVPSLPPHFCPSYSVFCGCSHNVGSRNE